MKQKFKIKIDCLICNTHIEAETSYDEKTDKNFVDCLKCKTRYIKNEKYNLFQ